MEQGMSVLVANQINIPSSLTIFVERIERLFHSAGLIFVGELGLGRELQRLGRNQCVGFVTYADVGTKLVRTVRRIVRRLSSMNVSMSGGPPGVGAIPAWIWGEMTKRETEVLELIRHRLSNKEIASILNVAEVTVKFHASNIFAKVKVARRRDLLALMECCFPEVRVPVSEGTQSAADLL
jgi:DNA-binding CsgD family transcriptional regulator